MDFRFRVVFLQESKDFLSSLDKKTRKKVLYNIWKARSTNDKELLKKLRGEIWELRTLYDKRLVRLLAFWDKTDNEDSLVISTHGFIKKTGKTPRSEIEKAEKIRIKYFREKKNSL